MFLNFVLVACGSAVGGALRYGASLVIRPCGGFPWATLAVNVVGSFLIGLLSGLIAHRYSGTDTGETIRLLAVVGFCGGFTTFSTFSNETFRLIGNSQILAALGYVLVSVLAGFAAVWIGSVVSR